ncbi:ALG-1 [Dirofilaria immitis]|nr:ALG-1 [Dirofilaria immitis]
MVDKMGKVLIIFKEKHCYERKRKRKKKEGIEATTGSTVGKGHGSDKQPKSYTFSCESAGIEQKFDEKHERIRELVRRPNHGKLGEQIELIANFKLLDIPSSLQIYCYHVDILKITKKNKIVMENRDICREIFWNVISNNEEIFGTGYFLVYDDCHSLYSLHKLKTEKPTLELQLFAEGKPNLGSTDISFLILISFTNYFTVNIDEQLPNFRTSMQFLDCLVSQRVRCPYMNMASSFYPFDRCIYMKPCESETYSVLNMGPGMEAWNGLYSAVKRCEKGLMLNVDVSTKVFYKVDMWLIDFYLAVLNEFMGRKRPYNIDEVMNETFALSANQRQQLKDALKGLMLKLTYDDRHVKFIDVGLPARIQSLDIHLKFPNLPVLHCGRTTRKDYFPMELLRLSDKVQRLIRYTYHDLTEPLWYRNGLAEKLVITEFLYVKVISGYGSESFGEIQKIDWFLKGMRISTDDEFIQQFGIIFPSVSGGVPQSERIFGRILPSPAIKFKAIELLATNGSWRLNNCFFQTASNVLFAVVFVDQAINIQHFREPFTTLIRACKLFGMKFVEENFGADTVEIYNWDTHREEADIHVRRIKVTCDKEEGIACQVILAETFLKMRGNPASNTVSHNICLKINVKLDGINSEVAGNRNYWEKFTDREVPTLFIGIDVTHPLSGDPLASSIAAIVGSLNVSATRYAASFKIQQAGLEVVTYTVDAFRKRIMEFHIESGCKPQHIVLFRQAFLIFDGVSDSEFLDVMNEELLCLKTAIHQLDRLYDPTISYIVVQKRHHTRFVEQGMKGNKGNIPPGTVVDCTITNPLLFDFYLCSHRGATVYFSFLFLSSTVRVPEDSKYYSSDCNISGTSKPSHYTVLYDSWHLSADEWQQMVYALCHVYARCNKSVSLPAPVYYAHLACDRARCLLKHTRMEEALRNDLSVHALEKVLLLIQILRICISYNIVT